MYSKMLPRCILFGSRVRRNKTFRLLSVTAIKRPRVFLVIPRPDKRPAKLSHLSATSISIDIYPFADERRCGRRVLERAVKKNIHI